MTRLTDSPQADPRDTDALSGADSLAARATPGDAEAPPARVPGRLRSSLIVGAFVVALCASIVVATFVGTANIGALDVLGIILRNIGLGALAPVPSAPPLIDALVWESRLPRVLLAAVVGLGLSVSGAVLQSITRNPLAEPYLLGVSSGASTGAVSIMILGLGSGAVTLSMGAFAGALVAFAIVLLLIGGGRVSNPARVVLTGVLVSQFFSAITSLVLMLDGDADATRGFTYWLLGSLGGARWEPLLVASAVIVLGAVGCLFLASALDAFTFGWDTASSLGVNVTLARVTLMVLTAFITAAAVAASGAIGFIGLLVPHIVRLLAGSTHRLLLPLAGLGGAIFLVWVDTFARSAFSPHEIPVGVITALLGAPVFAIVLSKAARQ
ncbi:FecCD family ABC transporter permease [Nocardiopsis alborubida]|uniref:Iron chelate uptake ABC transporter family permease subunit n=1 Tax=Nocardiopsis alborubida TaxID=146802 RepID=A0A7X6MGA2_9ACTN|nr:iron chelate uptake ABC transporter family permease subunit [Nocardiopsis alborubida]NKZ00416.1 iron chelate uptake ABC transporter family permease subunit [Nocardiopsis alborubida]